MKNRNFKVLCHKKIRNAGRGSKENQHEAFLMTVMSATFGALLEFNLCMLYVVSKLRNFLSSQSNSEDFSSEDERIGSLSLGVKKAGGWDEPNARDMGRMTSQPNAKGEMYILNDGIDMKAKIGAMERRLEELEMKKMQEVQAISQTPFQAMPCSICLSYEHLVEECPTIPTLSQRIDIVESSLNKKMDGVQSDLSQKIDNLQYSISRFANLNTVHEKGNFPSQPYQNSKGIHQVEAQKRESSMVKEVKTVITLRSGKEVDLPTCKLEHKVESETEKEKREEIKGKRKGKSTEKDGYNVDEEGEPQRIVIEEELMKKHMPPPFTQALYGKIIQTKSQVRDANFIWDPGKLNQDQIF
uniref:Uncharacterized protein n=1 Tax=Vitis vinifera TaxID=29760 RepID=A5AU53_VITVI|nr:hypothetical protein VITISV_039280 [Vitis vinifera]